MLEFLAENRESKGIEAVFRTEAGLVLTGAEVKAAKDKNLNLRGAHLKFLEGGPVLLGLRIGHYRHAVASFDELRSRKLLLKKREIEKIGGLISRKGFVCLPEKIYVKNSFVKVSLVVGRAIKKWEKKEKILDKQMKREQERELRGKKTY